MPKKIDPELGARAVRLVREHAGQYQKATAASVAVAKQLGVSTRGQDETPARAPDRSGVSPRP